MKNHQRRLNLFAFPAETNSLFVLLVLATLLLATLLGNVLALILGFGNSLGSLDTIERGSSVVFAFLPIVGYSGLAMFIVLVAAFIFYRRHPGKIRIRRKIRPITEADELLGEEVRQLANKAGINSPQVEMVPRGRNGSGGQAFGFFPRYSIRLDGGLRTWKKTRPEMFNAVVLHEMAHIAHQDISRSYFSDGIWRATLIFLIIPFILGICVYFVVSVRDGILAGSYLETLSKNLPILIGLLLQAGCMVAITAAIWARLLRVREFYADWTAVLWGAEAGLKKIFQEIIDHGEKPQAKIPLFRFHPTARERLGVIVQPELLFKISWSLAFLVGVLIAFFLAGFIYTGFSTFLLFQEIIRWNLPRVAWFLFFGLFILVGVMPIAWLISGTLGVQIQRQAVLELTTGQRGVMQYVKLIPPAIFLCAGLELGFIAVPFAISTPDSFTSWLIELLIYFPAQIAATWLSFCYIRFISIRTLAGNTGKKISFWRNSFIQLCTNTWLFFLFVPPLMLGRLLTGPNFEIMFSAFVISMAALLVLGPMAFGLTWIILKLFFESQSRKCPHCGKFTAHSLPAVNFCEHCKLPLGEWLYAENSLAAYEAENMTDTPNLTIVQARNPAG